jgi:dihydrolipoamide dehydrogenase
VTKLVLDAGTHRLIGAGIAGPDAGEWIAEAAPAIEMGADAGDVSMTVHPHPTLVEAVGTAAEASEGTITGLDLPPTDHQPHGREGRRVPDSIPDRRPVDTDHEE